MSTSIPSSRPLANPRGYNVIAAAFMQAADDLHIPPIYYRMMRDRVVKELGLDATLDEYQAAFKRYHAEKKGE